MSMIGGENKQVENLFLISASQKQNRRSNMRKNHKSPSRIKYDQNHPTISVRLPKDKREKLLAMLKTMDVTLPQLILNFIGEYEIKIKPIEIIKGASFKAGLGKGYQQGIKNCAIKYPCSKCGKEIVVSSKEEKKAIRDFMTESGWHHRNCA